MNVRCVAVLCWCRLCGILLTRVSVVLRLVTVVCVAEIVVLLRVVLRVVRDF